MPTTITSESSTSPVEFVMATVCKICAGPIEPLDHHLHCVACLGLAHFEAALDESDCGPSGPRNGRPIPRFPFQRTVSAPLLTSRGSHPLATRRGMTPYPSRPQRERGLGGIGARSIRQLGAFRPPRGAHEGSV